MSLFPQLYQKTKLSQFVVAMAHCTKPHWDSSGSNNLQVLWWGRELTSKGICLLKGRSCTYLDFKKNDIENPFHHSSSPFQCLYTPMWTCYSLKANSTSDGQPDVSFLQCYIRLHSISETLWMLTRTTLPVTQWTSAWCKLQGVYIL